MRVRNDLKKLKVYKQTLSKYKKKIIKSYPSYIIGLFIFCIISGIITNIFSEDTFGFLEMFILFLICSFFVTLFTLYQLFANYRIVDFDITRKKIVEGDDSKFYYIYDNKIRFRTEDKEMYFKLNEGFSYTLLCRGKCVVDIIDIMDMY